MSPKYAKIDNLFLETALLCLVLPASLLACCLILLTFYL